MSRISSRRRRTTSVRPGRRGRGGATRPREPGVEPRRKQGRELNGYLVTKLFNLEYSSEQRMIRVRAIGKDWLRTFSAFELFGWLTDWRAESRFAICAGRARGVPWRSASLVSPGPEQLIIGAAAARGFGVFSLGGFS